MISNSFLRGLDRRYWPNHSDLDGSYGVVTAADSEYSLELDILLESIAAQHPIPVHVFDLGLDDWHAAKIASLPLVTVIKPDLDDMPVEGDHWQAWLKPLLFRQSPYRHTIWLDADCVVLESLEPLFAILTDTPVLVADNYSPDLCYNDPRLYEIYPTPDSNSPPVNSGVVGLSRGRDDVLLSTWLNFVKEATSNPEIATMLRWWDQGALNWAVRRCQQGHLVICESRWNHPAKRSLYHRDGLLAQIEEAHPDNGIVHFVGPDKIHNLVVNRIRMVHQHGNPLKVVVLGLPQSGAGVLARALAIASPDYTLIKRDTNITEGDSEAVWRFLETWPYDNCSVILASGIGLAYHARLIQMAFPNCLYLVVMRDPVALIESRLRAGIYWRDSLERLPVFRQHAIRLAGQGPSIEPNPPNGLSLLEAHVWEAERSGNALANEVLRLPSHQTMMCRTETLRESVSEIVRFIGKEFDQKQLKRSLTQPQRPTTPTNEWVTNMTKHHKQAIRDRLEPRMEDLRRHLTADIDRTPLAYR